MEPRFHLGDDLNDLERALQELAPAPARLDVAQTMFRAGQASAGRPGPGRYFWPGTSALLAVVSLVLGAFLAMPDQPRIVYVPVDAAVGKEPMPQPAMVAKDHGTSTDSHRSAPSTISNEEIARLAPRGLNLLSHLRSRDLALVDAWDASERTSQSSSQASIPPLCSRDWRIAGRRGRATRGATSV